MGKVNQKGYTGHFVLTSYMYSTKLSATLVLTTVLIGLQFYMAQFMPVYDACIITRPFVQEKHHISYFDSCYIKGIYFYLNQ